MLHLGRKEEYGFISIANQLSYPITSVKIDHITAGAM